MIKQIVFDNYDETTVRKTIEAFKPFGPGAGPAEVSVAINGKRFVFSGESADHYVAQINATQKAMNDVK